MPSSTCAPCLAGKNLQKSFLIFVVTSAAFLLWSHTNQIKRSKEEEERNRRLGSNRVLNTEIVRNTAIEQYNVGKPVACSLIRAGFNHNYLVEMGNKKKYVLRVYLNDKYYIKDSNDFRFELDFIDYLIKDHGIPTVQPIKAKNGDWLSQIRFGELPQEGAAIKTTAATNNFIRHAALFEYAPGIEVANNNMELTPAHFKILGELQARIHQAADQFTNPNNHHRYQQDVSTYLLDEPLKTLERELSRYNMQQQMDFFKPTAQAIRDKVAKLPKEKPYYGLNHGDLHPGNMFWDDATQTFTVIDWDHSAYGWRVYDSASMVSPNKLTFFLMGYESVRPLSLEEKEAIPLFRLLRDIWDFGDILAFQPLWGDDNASDKNRKEELRGYLDRLRRVATAFEEQYGDGKAAVNQANTF